MKQLSTALSAALSKTDGQGFRYLLELTPSGGATRYLCADAQVIGGNSYAGELLTLGVLTESAARTTDIQLSILLNADNRAAVQLSADAKLLLWAVGTARADADLLLWGEVADPIRIADGKISFDIVARSMRQNQPVTRLVTATDFPGADPDAIGQTKPVLYGTVLAQPCLAVDAGSMTTLQAAAGVADTVLTVTDTAAFPTTGTLQIDMEQITYTGKTATTFTGCTRGSSATIASPHDASATVAEVQTHYDYLVADHPVQAIDNVYVDGVRQSGADFIFFPNSNGKAFARFYTLPTVIRQVNLGVNDSIAVVDGITITDGMVLNDGIAINDTLAIADGIMISDSNAVTDNTSISSAISVTDGIQVAKTGTITDGITVNDSNATTLPASVSSSTSTTAHRTNAIAISAATITNATGRWVYISTTVVAGLTITLSGQGWRNGGTFWTSDQSTVQLIANFKNASGGSLGTAVLYEWMWHSGNWTSEGGSMSATVMGDVRSVYVYLSSSIGATNGINFRLVYGNAKQILSAGASTSSSVSVSKSKVTKSGTITDNTGVSKTGQITALSTVTKTGGAALTGGASRTGFVGRTGAVSKTGIVSRSGIISKSGIASKTGTVVLTGNSVADTKIGGAVTADVRGWEDDVNGTITGTPNALIERPDHIARHLLLTYSGATASEVPAGAFDAFTGQTLSVSLTINMTVRDLLQRIAHECNAVVAYAGNRWLMRDRSNGTAATTLADSDIVRQDSGASTLAESRVGLRGIVNRYLWRAGLSATRRRWAASDEINDAASQISYGVRADHITLHDVHSKAQALTVLNWQLARAANPNRAVITCTVMLGHYALEIGDRVNVASVKTGTTANCEITAITRQTSGQRNGTLSLTMEEL